MRFEFRCSSTCVKDPIMKPQRQSSQAVVTGINCHFLFNLFMFELSRAHKYNVNQQKKFGIVKMNFYCKIFYTGAINA